MKKRNLQAVLIVLVVVLVFTSCASSQDASGLPQDIGVLPVLSTSGVDNNGREFEMGQAAPDFLVVNKDGSTSSLSDWQGQPVVINFWASWCGPCKAEMPEFVEAYEAHREDGLVILGINADLQKQEEKALEFMDEYRVSFPVALERRNEIMRLFETTGLPTTVFIDREGNVAGIWKGYLSRELLDEFIAKIL
ncbi:MAG: TlpA disulfide reductase family protein [Chloroflexota bacterium]|nr:TlpA disulfide reductase family protein [Chloroflexota bacterium]